MITLQWSDLLFVAFFGALAWYWFTGIRVRELAISAARRSTDLADVQLLDQTVSLARVSMSRDRKQRWRIWREYRFEYSRDGLSRETGHIIMLGQQLEAIIVAESPTVH
ncbi:MAG: DUF3301 domain-containing protein [Pseudomonadota bacterium]